MPVTCIAYLECLWPCANIQKRCRRVPTSALKGLHSLGGEGTRRPGVNFLVCSRHIDPAIDDVPQSSHIVAGKNPQIVGRQLQKAFAATGGQTSIATQAQCAELEQVLLAITEEHAGYQLGLHAIVTGARCDSRALEADDAGRFASDLERAARCAPQAPAI